MLIRLIIIILILLAIDFYGYYGLRKLYRLDLFSRYKRIITRAYWFMDAGFILFSIVWTIIIRSSSWPDYVQYRSYFYITGAFILIFLPKLLYLIFVILDDIKIVLLWIIRQIFNGKSKKRSEAKRPVPALPVIGFVLSVMMFGWVLYGVVYGRFNFKITEVEVEVPGLPDSFDGFRIIQISDTHFGSFARKRPVERGLRKIGKVPHDILVFTGDMVNNEAVEAERFIQGFRAINSSYGMFSILGNHDMGDYRRWYTIEEKMANLEQLEVIQEDMGFHLLRNEHYFVTRGNDSLMIVGIDNWGLPPFAQYGDLDKALGDYAEFPFKILLSHDPSHWRAQVIPETDIFLTLAGHTHGMQAGFITRWFQWSPVSVKYPEWGGLYHEGDQKLYVNRGFGFIGFPGRLGMRPEITLLVLRRK
jgi:uncharacterized protein